MKRSGTADAVPAGPSYLHMDGLAAMPRQEKGYERLRDAHAKLFVPLSTNAGFPENAPGKLGREVLPGSRCRVECRRGHATDGSAGYDSEDRRGEITRQDAARDS